VHKILLNSVLLFPIVSGGVWQKLLGQTPLSHNPLVFLPLEGRLGSGPWLVDQIGSGVRVSVSFRQKYPRGSVLRCPPAKKNRRFQVQQPTFLFPWRRPCDYYAICCTDEKTIPCLPNPSQMYLSIFNSFRVIRCLSQCVSPKIVFFQVPQPTFLFPLETPLRLSRNVLHGWKDNSMLAKPLAACTYLYSIVSELYDA